MSKHVLQIKVCSYFLDILMSFVILRSFVNLFLVQINDISAGLLSNPRLFAGDTSPFSVFRDRNT